jgi:hypothetical protein
MIRGKVKKERDNVRKLRLTLMLGAEKDYNQGRELAACEKYRLKR